MANNSRPYSKIAVPQPHPGVRKNLSERAISADNPDNVDPDVSPAGQEAELVLHASLKAGSVAQIVVAIIAVTGFLYLLKFVMVTMLTALLLSFILEPFVCSLNRVGVSRSVGAMLMVALVAISTATSSYLLFNRVKDFATELPQYSERIRSTLRQLQEPISKLEMSTRSIVTSPKGGQDAVPVRVQEEPIFPRVIFADSGAIKEFLLAVGFVPFLTYFMLTCKEHAHSATVSLFPKEHQMTAYRTVATISAMIRSFVVGNLVVGIISAIASGTAFWLLGIPYFYFLGIISGFASMIPSIGALLALLPPLIGGLGVLHGTGVAVAVLAVFCIHAVMMNFIYPKLMGKRLRLNPLAVVFSLLFWAWIWGAMGLIFAVPIIAAAKIVCDYTDTLQALGVWLGNENPVSQASWQKSC